MPGKQRRILFQGDSITDGNRGRSDDPNHIHGHGYQYIVAARLGYELADSSPLFINRGVSGNRVADLCARWNDDALALQPDLISILVGVNDAHYLVNNPDAGAVDGFEETYRHLLEGTREALPGVALVLCEPFVLRVGMVDEKWSEWWGLISRYQRVVRDLAQGFDAVFVPLQDAFDRVAEGPGASYWIWDGIHPTTAGHEVIARRWLDAVQGSRHAIR